MRRIRCAIYTRKSSEDGLEQDFNSLDAQRVACEAYIASQKHEGWELLPDHYDDGGISGGHLERPALQRLMQAVDGKRVDQIVVYKIDRLTRSLADFAKLVDRLAAAETSFVSVTQSFNTATSMGRLTLNMLLSFAQFEVGYRKPPKNTRLRKGQSGNPKGRPKGARGLKTDLRAELSERVTITEDGRRKTLTKQQLVVKQLTGRAVKGDIRAISKLAELAIALLSPEDDASQAEDKLSEEDEAILQSFLERNAGEQGNEQ